MFLPVLKTCGYVRINRKASVFAVFPHPACWQPLGQPPRGFSGKHRFRVFRHLAHIPFLHPVFRDGCGWTGIPQERTNLSLRRMNPKRPWRKPNANFAGRAGWIPREKMQKRQASMRVERELGMAKNSVRIEKREHDRVRVYGNFRF